MTETLRESTAALFRRVLGMAVCGCLATPASAEILYDTTSMTDNNTYTTASQNFIGGVQGTPAGVPWDVQVADDFTLGNAATITGATGDFLSMDLHLPPSDGVLVEFFADVGGEPSDAATVAVLTGSFSTSTFTNHLAVRNARGMRIAVDLSAAGITLGAGTWWMALTPVDETPNGGRYFQVRDTVSPLLGATSHARNGGIAHGNGYGGGTGGGGAWRAFGEFGGGDAGDVAMRIEGIVIPAPGVLAVTGLAGLARCRHRRSPGPV